MKRVLLTGASGRIGINLVRPLITKGYDVRAFILKNDPAREDLTRLGCEIADGDFRDEESVRRAVKGCDVVIHLGAVMRLPPTMTENTFWSINATGTFNMVRASMGEKVKRFIFASTDNVYSAMNYQYLPIDEKHPQDSYSLYGMVKTASECIVRGAWKEAGLPITIIRFGSVCTGDEALLGWHVGSVMRILKNTATRPSSSVYNENVKEPWKPLEPLMDDEEKLIIPRGPDFRSWRKHLSDVRDSVQGVLLALENEEAIGEDFNILGPYAATWEQAVKYISEKTGLPYTECVLNNYCQWELSNEKAKRILGYNPQYDIYKMMDSALDYQSGKDTGVLCPKAGYGFTVYNPLE